MTEWAAQPMAVRPTAAPVVKTQAVQRAAAATSAIRVAVQGAMEDLAQSKIHPTLQSTTRAVPATSMCIAPSSVKAVAGTVQNTNTCPTARHALHPKAGSSPPAPACAIPSCSKCASSVPAG